MYDNKILFSRDNHTKNIDGILNAIRYRFKVGTTYSNVYKYTVLIANEIELDEHNKKLLKPYILLHDIGKISMIKI